jgi:hypothetical protein
MTRAWEGNITMIFRKQNGGQGLDLFGSGYGQVAGICECGSEPLGSIKFREFLD